MIRRSFLKNAAAAGAAMAAISQLPACDQPAASSSKKENDPFNDFDFLETTIADLQQLMVAGKLTAEALTQAYLIRIEAIDKNGPGINSVIEINPEALTMARTLDEERKTGKVRSSLHGIPILIKDNIDTADQMETTAGALALQGNKAAKDATIVRQLREAGAVLLGKTNLSEWANFRSTQSCSGWSSRGGQTKNPYVLAYNPCGSSSGSGAAVAANLCAVAVGTETDGSVTCPASANGLVGIKPTVGLCSRAGIIPISATQDTAGPLARTVKDAALLLSFMAGPDEQDAIPLKNTQPNLVEKFLQDLNEKGLQGRRIGIDVSRRSKYYQLNNLLEGALAVLKQQGATVIEVEYLAAIDKLGAFELEILQHEFKEGVNQYLRQAKAKVKSLEEVIAFNKANEAQAMPYFKQEQLEACAKKGDLNSATYKEALLKGRDGCRSILDTVMARHNLDALCGITMGPACSIDPVYGDRYSDDFLTSPAAIAGYPHISVPCGLMAELPVGFSLFAGPWQEDKLIKMAYAFEQATKARTLPKYLTGFGVAAS